jgi:hypothetical protein
MATQNEIAVLIHQQLGQTLREVFANPRGVIADSANPFDVSGGTLLEQLQAPNEDATRITLRVILNLVPEGPASDSEMTQRAGAALLSELEDRWSNIKALTCDDLGTILPLATIANAALNLATIPQKVERALLGYFFRLDTRRSTETVSSRPSISKIWWRPAPMSSQGGPSRRSFFSPSSASFLEPPPSTTSGISPGSLLRAHTMRRAICASASARSPTPCRNGPVPMGRRPLRGSSGPGSGDVRRWRSRP